MKTKSIQTTISYSLLKTPLGELLLVANPTELIGLYFADCDHVPAQRGDWVLDARHPILRQAGEQLEEYFAGKRSRFSLPLRLAGTDFQERVWREIARIPFGQTVSYSDLARKAGKPRAVRAAGTCTGRNPLSIIVPCHRVVGKDGGITGYAGTPSRKRHLLELEQVKLPLGKRRV